MSEMAKQARQAMKAKAGRLTSADPHQKVDSSTWTPPEALNTEVKTGLRPISRRAFKKGGKVIGAKPKANLGKSTRGGNKPITPNTIANKDVKAANQDREGLKHIGGLKTGGRAKKANGGAGQMPLPVPRPKNLDAKPAKPVDRKLIEPGDAASRDLNQMLEIQRQEEAAQPHKKGGKVARCYGGKTKKAGGGAMSAAEKMMKKAQDTAGVPSGGIYGAGFSPTAAGSMSPAGALGKQKMKKGGMAKHDDEKADMALIKKMVKPSAMKRKGKMGGGELGMMGGLLPMAMNAMDDDKDGKKSGGRTGRKTGGGVFSGPGYPGKVPGATGGRTARATGGKTKGKGKTNINIVIAAGKPAGAPDMMGANPMGGPTQPPGMDGQGPGVVAVPMPPIGGAPGGMPMPAPMPMPPAAAGPAPRKAGGRIGKFFGGSLGQAGGGMQGRMGHMGRMGGQQAQMPAAPVPPMGGGNKGIGQQGQPAMQGAPIPANIANAYPQIGGQGMATPLTQLDAMGTLQNAAGQMGQVAPIARKSGGRLTKVAKSYKDMQAGAGSGEGRLQKTDIAKLHKDAPAFKKGGKVYRSYKDMDAGAGSGEGRLEKSEIQARKK